MVEAGVSIGGKDVKQVRTAMLKFLTEQCPHLLGGAIAC